MAAFFIGKFKISSNRKLGISEWEPISKDFAEYTNHARLFPSVRNA